MAGETKIFNGFLWKPSQEVCSDKILCSNFLFRFVNSLFYSHKYILRGCVNEAINLTVNPMIISQNENSNTVFI